MERQLRAQTPPCPNISTLCDRLNIWYNLSPVVYQTLVASMHRRVAAVLKKKGGATRYSASSNYDLQLFPHPSKPKPTNQTLPTPAMPRWPWYYTRA
ncbi:hypothetical protein AVEN_215103-1, partial [Araneus ventricosus]